MESLITICARGGSQGVKNKNIRPLMGKPLIAYTIECALKWEKAKRVIFSTDSEQIARIAIDHGAEAPFLRPASLAKWDVPKIAVVRHALCEVERDSPTRHEVIIDLDVTAPIRRVDDVERAYQLFLERRPRALFSVVKARKNPYYNVVEVDDQGYAHLSKDPGEAITCRQNAPAVYDMNASIHIYSREHVLDDRDRHICSERAVVYVMDDLSAVDIDSELDFKFIEFLMKEGVFIP
jgi:CMP-N,N'-diacetyllegionaminic acid synthase